MRTLGEAILAFHKEDPQDCSIPVNKFVLRRHPKAECVKVGRCGRGFTINREHGGSSMGWGLTASKAWEDTALEIHFGIIEANDAMDRKIWQMKRSK